MGFGGLRQESFERGCGGLRRGRAVESTGGGGERKEQGYP